VKSLADRSLIGTLGDLIEDLVVELAEPMRLATDTDVSVARRRGGSAANVATAAVVGGARGRFIGNVGADDVGDRLVDQLQLAGVDVAVARTGRTGTVVALIDELGERSLLTDRGSSGALDRLPTGALDGLSVLHVPAYALADEPLASVAEIALCESASRGQQTSLDASAVPVIERIGADAIRSLVERVRPTVVFCNADEALALGVDRCLVGATLTVVKNGALPVVIHALDGAVIEVPALRVETIVDTTGAGDAFAAAFMIGVSRGLMPEECAVLGHDLAARSLLSKGALQGCGSSGETGTSGE